MYPLRDFKLGELKNISSHKYKCVDNSIMQNYVLAPMFRKIQQFVPVWITPNQITMTGFVTMLTSLLLTFYLDKNLSNRPRYLPLANLVLLFLYLVADGVDGIHARATNQCSPLGQILDHGVDSICVFVCAITLGSSLGLGFSNTLMAFIINFLFAFYAGIIHEKFVGFFKFGYISGCSEGIVALFIVHILSFTYPKVFKIFGGNYQIFGFVLTKKIIHTALLFAFVFNLVDLLYSVLTVITQQRFYDFAKSIYVPSLLFFLMIMSFNYDSKADSDKNWAILCVFSHSFTSCYIEELLSFIVKSKFDNMVAIASYTLLCMCIMAVSHLKMQGLRMYTIVVISAIHFVLRHGSIIYNMCKKLGFKFLGSK